MAEKTVDEAGLAAARAFAGWHLGYKNWGDLFVEAYLNPERTMRVLREEMEDDGTV